MGAPRETVIACLPGQSDTERLEIVLISETGLQSHLQLRQQSWGDGVGWFTQSTVELEPQQVAALKMALGTVPTGTRRPAAPAQQTGPQRTGAQRTGAQRTGLQRMGAQRTSVGGPSAGLRLVRADSA